MPNPPHQGSTTRDRTPAAHQTGRKRVSNKHQGRALHVPIAVKGDSGPVSGPKCGANPETPRKYSQRANFEDPGRYSWNFLKPGNHWTFCLRPVPDLCHPPLRFVPLSFSGRVASMGQPELVMKSWAPSCRFRLFLWRKGTCFSGGRKRFFCKGVFAPSKNRGFSWTWRERRIYILCTKKRGFFLKLLTTTKMTKTVRMVRVSHVRTLFAEHPVCARLSFGKWQEHRFP